MMGTETRKWVEECSRGKKTEFANKISLENVVCEYKYRESSN
jgi:hypothetical protein